jgi:hypothetical protein
MGTEPPTATATPSDLERERGRDSPRAARGAGSWATWPASSERESEQHATRPEPTPSSVLFPVRVRCSNEVEVHYTAGRCPALIFQSRVESERDYSIHPSTN